MRGNWCLRIIISTSTPKSSGAPSTSMTRPIGGRVGVGQLVISTSTTRPSRLSWAAAGVASCPARGAAWRLQRGSGSSWPSGMRMCWVMRSSKGTTTLSRSPVRPRIVKGADDGGVAALEDADDAAEAAAVGLGRLHLDEHLVALHGAVDLVGRNEDVLSRRRFRGDLPRAFDWADKAVAVAMQVEAAGGEVVAGAAAAARLWECSSVRGRAWPARRDGEAGQLLQQQAAFPAARQAQFAHQLLVSGFLAGRAGNPRHQFTIGHTSRVQPG